MATAGELYRIIYLSTTNHDLSEDELAAILDVSWRNNGRDGLTGALAYHDRAFIQVLEGPREPVEAAFARILGDGRHGGIMVCERAMAEERAFARWSMGWVRRPALAAAGFDPGVLYMHDTPSAVVNAMLRAYRRTVRLGEHDGPTPGA